MGSFGVVHWLAVLLVVILMFGTKKIGGIGGDLGKLVKGFKDGVMGMGKIEEKGMEQQAVGEKYIPIEDRRGHV